MSADIPCNALAVLIKVNCTRKIEFVDPDENREHMELEMLILAWNFAL